MSIISKRPAGRTPERAKGEAHNEARNSNERLAKTLKAALAKKELVKKSTIFLYSLKTEDSPFGIPFAAVSDHFACLAGKQLLPLANVYKVGSFCLLDGRMIAERRPRVVLDKIES